MKESHFLSKQIVLKYYFTKNSQKFKNSLEWFLVYSLDKFLFLDVPKKENHSSSDTKIASTAMECLFWTLWVGQVNSSFPSNITSVKLRVFRKITLYNLYLILFLYFQKLGNFPGKVLHNKLHKYKFYWDTFWKKNFSVNKLELMFIEESVQKNPLIRLLWHLPWFDTICYVRVLSLATDKCHTVGSVLLALIFSVLFLLS